MIVINSANASAGYNYIQCGDKSYYRHRIISFAFLNLDINNIKSLIDHIDRNKLNNHVNNLKIYII